MNGGVTRRRLLGGLGAALAGPGLPGMGLAGAPARSPRPVARPAAAPHATAPAPDALIAEAALGGKLGYVVADARTGTVLEVKNPLLPLPPASVIKAVTAVYGLETLGADHRFHTRLIATAPIADGRLDGDLILAGGGDPMTQTDDLAEMARALAATGLRRLTGRFLVWPGPLPCLHQIDPDQPAHVGYNPAVCGLNLNYNRVYFEWKPQGAEYAVSMDARSERFRPEVHSARMQVVARDAPVYTYRQDGTVDRWTVARGALGDGGGRWLPVRRPDLYAAEVFGWLARAHGIALPAARATRSLPAGSVLVERPSPPLHEITRLMLKYSTNLTAEVIGLSASRARGRPAQSLRASAREMERWMKQALDTRHARLVNHSGLSDAARLPAIDMVKALARADGQLHGLLKQLPPLDAQGRRDDSARHVIRAKTGTLNFVSSLAGYLTTPGGRDLTFAILAADMQRRAAIPRAQRERPAGARGWSRRARRLQHQLLARWAALYDV